MFEEVYGTSVDSHIIMILFIRVVTWRRTYVIKNNIEVALGTVPFGLVLTRIK